MAAVGPDGSPLTPPGPAALRLGADLPTVELPAGGYLQFAPTALERVSLVTETAATLQLRRDAGGIGRLVSRKVRQKSAGPRGPQFSASVVMPGPCAVRH